MLMNPFQSDLFRGDRREVFPDVAAVGGRGALIGLFRQFFGENREIG
jgi:hypothetical protein